MLGWAERVVGSGTGGSAVGGGSQELRAPLWRLKAVCGCRRARRVEPSESQSQEDGGERSGQHWRRSRQHWLAGKAHVAQRRALSGRMARRPQKRKLARRTRQEHRRPRPSVGQAVAAAVAGPCRRSELARVVVAHSSAVLYFLSCVLVVLLKFFYVLMHDNRWVKREAGAATCQKMGWQMQMAGRPTTRPPPAGAARASSRPPAAPPA